MRNNKNNILRQFPSMQAILKNPEVVRLTESFSYEFVKERLGDLIKLKKNEILGTIDSNDEFGIPYNYYLTVEFFTEKLKEDLNDFSFSLKRVINGTGVVVHTNLGRSILSKSAVDNISRISSSYSNLEFNLAEGERGKRYSHVEYLLKKIIKCEKAIVVNNNAAAVFMTLSSFCSGQKKEVIVSRGELVEIGGSFRIPDIMRASGAVLVEVGATNKTRPEDYESNINENTALLLKVHQSNFRMVGFVHELSSKDIVSIGKKYRIPVVEDLGSGSFINLSRFGLPYEPTAQEVVSTGMDVVTFSGDKLLGGPQAGIIAGKKKYIDMIATNPLNRAFRIDKMTIASLEATLFEYLDMENAVKKIPTLSLIAQSEQDIKKKAKKFLNKLKKFEWKNKNLYNFKILEDLSIVGGGALPDYGLKTYALSITHKTMSADNLSKIFRGLNIPIIGKIKNAEFLLDMRTVLDTDFKDILYGLSIIDI
ncbi:MAG TPA: L-seryl-tRNA(Sec) selenium transferase [Ignavibacteria bacterium]|nr:L-seryl-tRNA(Sec) selenium transferase [Ignavibacteria bacterium]